MSFYDTLKIAAQGFRLNIPRTFSRLANGQVIPQSLGFPYWSGVAQIAPAYHADAGAYEVQLMGLDRPGQTFLAYDSRYNGPRADPGGVILGSAAPTLHSINANNQSVRIAGLPGNYVISAGDYIGWQRASGIYSLHRAKATVTASGAGLTPFIAVEPLVLQGEAAGVAVALVEPVCRAMVTESNYGNGARLITSGASFAWQEVRR